MRAPALACLLLCLLLTACAAIPADPRHTLDEVRARGELVVGVSPAPPWTLVSGPDQPQGSEVELARGFAARLGVRPRWVIGGEQSLVKELEHGRIQLAVGGFTSDSPWSSRAGATRAYAVTRDSEGATQRHIMLVPVGENAFLGELERYLDEETGKAPR